jgi:hypothetical protein
MKRSTLFYISAAIALISVMIAVYFLVPGIYHPYLSLSSGHPGLVDATKHPKVVRSVHRIYAAAFFFLAAIFASIAFLNRPKKVSEMATK